MKRLTKFLNQRSLPLIFGVVHLNALPRTAQNCSNIEEIAAKAVDETRLYVNADVDGIIVENMGDVPYIHPMSMTPETVAYMSRCALDMRRSIDRKISDKFLWGVSVLAACNKEALAVAAACEYDFIRCEGFVFAHVADEGLTDSCAAELLRYRKAIGAQHVSILTDIKKKHSAHSITSDVSLVETAEAAEFFLSDGVIVTGSATGRPPSARDVHDVKSSLKNLPVVVGSGVNDANATDFVKSAADVLIVGSHFKIGGNWSNDIDVDRLNDFMETIRKLRSKHSK